MLYFKFILTKNSLLSKICSRGNNHSTNQKGNSKSFFTRFEPPNSGAKIVFLISKIPIKSWLLPRPGFTLALAKVLGNEGKTTPSQKAKIVNWRCLLNEIRTYFEQNRRSLLIVALRATIPPSGSPPDGALGAEKASEFLFYNIKSFQFSKELSKNSLLVLLK